MFFYHFNLMTLALVLVGVIVVATLIYRAVSMKPTPPMVAAAGGVLRPLGSVGAPAGAWHVSVLRNTFPYSGHLGRLELSEGQLQYIPASMVEPAWSFPAVDVRASPHPVGLNDPATVDLRLPNGTTLALRVSTKPLDGSFETTLDDLFERRAGHNLIAVLEAHEPR